MPTKIVQVPGLGEVLIVRRRGARHLRLTITLGRQIRVSQPYWTPYAAGLAFAKSKAQWIRQQLVSQHTNMLQDGMIIGKSHRLRFHQTQGSRDTARTRVTAGEVLIYSNLPWGHPSTQKQALAASERALRLEAEDLLPGRLDQLASQYDFGYTQLRVRKLTARWGSCSANKAITLSYFLMQLPWNLVDYVLLHELIHTKHLHHGPDFWQAFLEIEPQARHYQKIVRSHKPRVEAYTDLD